MFPDTSECKVPGGMLGLVTRLEKLMINLLSFFLSDFELFSELACVSSHIDSVS